MNPSVVLNIIAATGNAPDWLLTGSLYAVSFTGLIVFVNVFTRWGPFKFVWERLVTRPRREELVSVIDQHVRPIMEENRAVLQETLAEFRPNGGGSMRDKINKLAEDAEHLRETTQRIEGTVSMATAAVSSISGNLEAVGGTVAQHVIDDTNFFRAILKRLDDVDNVLAEVQALDAAVKHDLEQFNEIDNLGAEGRIERRKEVAIDLHARLDAIHEELRNLGEHAINHPDGPDETEPEPSP